MERLEQIFDAIDREGFAKSALQDINVLINDIENGRADFYRFNQPEHAGLCQAGKVLIGASIVASYATASLRTSGNAEGSQGEPSNWEIDALQEKLIEQFIFQTVWR